MLLIQDKTQLNKAEINIRQALRIELTRKKYAVLSGEKLHLVNNLDRLIFDTLKSENLYFIEVFQLR